MATKDTSCGKNETAQPEETGKIGMVMERGMQESWLSFRTGDVLLTMALQEYLRTSCT